MSCNLDNSRINPLELHLTVGDKARIICNSKTYTQWTHNGVSKRTLNAIHYIFSRVYLIHSGLYECQGQTGSGYTFVATSKLYVSCRLKQENVIKMLLNICFVLQYHYIHCLCCILLKQKINKKVFQLNC